MAINCLKIMGTREPWADGPDEACGNTGEVQADSPRVVDGNTSEPQVDCPEAAEKNLGEPWASGPGTGALWYAKAQVDSLSAEGIGYVEPWTDGSSTGAIGCTEAQVADSLWRPSRLPTTTGSLWRAGRRSTAIDESLWRLGWRSVVTGESLWRPGWRPTTASSMLPHLEAGTGEAMSPQFSPCGIGLYRLHWRAQRGPQSPTGRSNHGPLIGPLTGPKSLLSWSLSWAQRDGHLVITGLRLGWRKYWPPAFHLPRRLWSVLRVFPPLIKHPVRPVCDPPAICTYFQTRFLFMYLMQTTSGGHGSQSGNHCSRCFHVQKLMILCHYFLVTFVFVDLCDMHVKPLVFVCFSLSLVVYSWQLQE